MSWKRRLRELVLAGGMAAAAAGCDDRQLGGGIGPPMCNANPDPCCLAPESQDCLNPRDMAVPLDLTPPRDLEPRD